MFTYLGRGNCWRSWACVSIGEDVAMEGDGRVFILEMPHCCDGASFGFSTHCCIFSMSSLCVEDTVQHLGLALSLGLQ